MVPRHLRHLLLARAARTVTKRGVRLDGRVYNCAELCGWVGERVEVRYLPHHHHEVEVFRKGDHSGEHLATAVLVDELAADDVTRLLAHRAAERSAREDARAAAADRRTRFAAMTQLGPLVATTMHTADGTAVEQAHQGDEALRRAPAGAWLTTADPGQDAPA